MTAYLTTAAYGRTVPNRRMAAIRYLFHRHHLSKRMLSLISEYGGGKTQ